MYQQLWGYKVEEKLYLGVREQKRLNTTGLEHEPERSQRTFVLQDRLINGPFTALDLKQANATEMKQY
jgi:hypothetical protein